MKKHRVLAIIALTTIALTACGIETEVGLAPGQAVIVDPTEAPPEATPAVCPELTSVIGADGKLPEIGTVGGINYSFDGYDEYSEYKERGYYMIYQDGAYHCIICQGEHSTGGYSVKIVDILTNSDSAWKIVVEETSHGPTDCVTEAFTYPACFINLSDMPADLTVVNTNGVPFECLGIINRDETTETTEPASLPAYQSVKDYASYLTIMEGLPKYSECPDDSGLMFYFDLLDEDTYYVVSQDGVDYLLFCYAYSEYGSVIDEVTSINKDYANGSLSVNVNATFRKTNAEGCEPDHSYVNCILKLDEPFDSVTVNEQEFTLYAGGCVRIGERWGVCDADLNMIYPPIFDGICRLYNFYRVWNEEGTGLLDENFHEILPTKYQTVDYLSPDRYLVTNWQDSIQNSKISIIDGSGNEIYGNIDGLFLGSGTFHNHARQRIYAIARDPKPPLYGIVDDQLNIILPAKYADITMWAEDTADQFYVVGNDKAEYAVFDPNGNQVTEFQNSSIYDVQTAYFEHLRNKATE